MMEVWEETAEQTEWRHWSGRGTELLTDWATQAELGGTHGALEVLRAATVVRSRTEGGVEAGVEQYECALVLSSAGLRVPVPIGGCYTEDEVAPGTPIPLLESALHPMVALQASWLHILAVQRELEEDRVDLHTAQTTLTGLRQRVTERSEELDECLATQTEVGATVESLRESEVRLSHARQVCEDTLATKDADALAASKELAKLRQRVEEQDELLESAYTELALAHDDLEGQAAALAAAAEEAGRKAAQTVGVVTVPSSDEEMLFLRPDSVGTDALLHAEEDLFAPSESASPRQQVLHPIDAHGESISASTGYSDQYYVEDAELARVEEERLAARDAADERRALEDERQMLVMRDTLLPQAAAAEHLDARGGDWDIPSDSSDHYVIGDDREQSEAASSEAVGSKGSDDDYDESEDQYPRSEGKRVQAEQGEQQQQEQQHVGDLPWNMGGQAVQAESDDVDESSLLSVILPQAEDRDDGDEGLGYAARRAEEKLVEEEEEEIDEMSVGVRDDSDVIRAQRVDDMLTRAKEQLAGGGGARDKLSEDDDDEERSEFIVIRNFEKDNSAMSDE
jgi:hypothetical protein